MKSPEASSPSVSKSMKSNRSSGTKPELVLSKLLRKKIKRNDLPGTPDFVYQKKNLAVFIHGCFWHRCPVCKLPLPKTHRIFWKNKFERNIQRDKLVKRKLRSIGWKNLVVWEHEMRKDPVKIAKKIKRVARNLPTIRNLS